MTRVLIFGSHSLTWKHLPVFRALALHASLETSPECSPAVPPMSMDLMRFLLAGGDDEWPRLSTSESLVLVHGDRIPSAKVPGAIGADKLAELACMETWPERRTLRRIRLDPQPGETREQTEGRRNGAMVAARPHRTYCVHTDLDASVESRGTAAFLTAAGIPYVYVRVTPAGDLVSVEQR